MNEKRRKEVSVKLSLFTDNQYLHVIPYRYIQRVPLLDLKLVVIDVHVLIFTYTELIYCHK